MSHRRYRFGDDRLRRDCNIGVWLNWKEHAAIQRAVVLEKTHISRMGRMLLVRWAEVVVREHEGE